MTLEKALPYVIPVIPGVTNIPLRINRVLVHDLPERPYRGGVEPYIYIHLGEAELHQNIDRDVAGEIPVKALVKWAVKEGYLK